MAIERKTPNLDTVTTINDDGSKYNIHPADVKGSFTTRRRLTAWLLIAVYVALPWIQINGYPAVFIDLNELRFHFFGFTKGSERTPFVLAKAKFLRCWRRRGPRLPTHAAGHYLW